MTRLRLEYVHEYRDCRGKLRRYFRRPGFKQIPLPGPPGSAEFMRPMSLRLRVSSRPLKLEPQERNREQLMPRLSAITIHWLSDRSRSTLRKCGELF
jgi:hypothetical protein